MVHRNFNTHQIHQIWLTKHLSLKDDTILLSVLYWSSCWDECLIGVGSIGVGSYLIWSRKLRCFLELPVGDIRWGSNEQFWVMRMEEWQKTQGTLMKISSPRFPVVAKIENVRCVPAAKYIFLMELWLIFPTIYLMFAEGQICGCNLGVVQWDQFSTLVLPSCQTLNFSLVLGIIPLCAIAKNLGGGGVTLIWSMLSMIFFRLFSEHYGAVSGFRHHLAKVTGSNFWCELRNCTITATPWPSRKMGIQLHYPDLTRNFISRRPFLLK